MLIDAPPVASQVTTIRVLLGWMREKERGTLAISQVATKVLLTEFQPIREGFLCLISCHQHSVSCS